MEEVNNQEEHFELTEKAKELLRKINEVWKKLQQEPKGSYAPGFLPLPPCKMTYWRNLEKLDELLVELNGEGISIPFFEFRHTMNKEGAFVRDFTYNSRCSQSSNESKLTSLMNKANGHIKRDLFSILTLSQSVVTNDTNLKNDE